MERMEATNDVKGSVRDLIFDRIYSLEKKKEGNHYDNNERKRNTIHFSSRIQLLLQVLNLQQRFGS